MTDPSKIIASYNALSAVGKVRSWLPLRDSRMVSTGYMRNSWPYRKYWHFIILGEREAYDWVSTLAGPPEFMGAINQAVGRW